MKIRIDFGHTGKRKELNWYYDLKSFPKLIQFDGHKWSWFMYDKDPSGQYDEILTYSQVPTYDPDFYADGYVDFEQEFGFRANTGCECGAIHTSFPQIHMFFCPQWRKM